MSTEDEAEGGTLRLQIGGPTDDQVLVFQRNLRCRIIHAENGEEGTEVSFDGHTGVVWDAFLFEVVDLGGGPTRYTAYLLNHLYLEALKPEN